VLGWGILTLHSISSRAIGVEVGPILVVDWIEIFDSARRRTAPIATVLDFIATEATDLAASGKIVGVAFDPLNPSVLRFVEKRLKTVRLGEPSWVFIKADTLLS
jgi:hypothetical protein